MKDNRIRNKVKFRLFSIPRVTSNHNDQAPQHPSTLGSHITDNTPNPYQA